MKYIDMAAVSMKLAGIFIIIFFLSSVPEYISHYMAYGDDSTYSFLLLVIIPVAIPVTIGLLMLFFPLAIYGVFDWSVKEISNENEDIRERQKIEYPILISLGIYLLFQSTSDIVFNISNYFIAKLTNTVFELDYIIYSDIVTTLFELLLSIVIILYSKKLLNYLEDL